MSRKLASYSVMNPDGAQAHRDAVERDQVAIVPLPDPVAVPGLLRPRATSETANSATSCASCRTYRFPVRVSPASEETIELSGELTTRVPVSDEITVQVLLAGGSNNTSYWDWPVDPENQSYVRHATRDGFMTLNLDRPGYGKSDHPDPTRMDFATQGYIVNQVVEHLKRGSLGHRFKRVVLNGHSMGGMVAWHAASQSSAADAVIVSGVGHNLASDAMAAVFNALEPIENNPRYGRGTGWLPGYYARRLTPDLPTSVGDWYTALLQDTVMAAELDAMVNDSRDYSITSKIKIPVLFALGQHDLRWCTTTGDCMTDPAFLLESNYYHPDTDFTAFIIPETGHLNNKDPGAHHFFKRVTNWLTERGL